MNIDERRQCIVKYVREHESVSVNNIIEMLDDSPATIRRDLIFLESNGIIQRGRGFVKYVQPQVVSNIKITPGKVAVANAAAGMLPKNATILFDSGASTAALARIITDRTDLIIITNSLAVANIFSNVGPTVFMTGGVLESRQEALVGPDAEAYIRNLHVPLLILTTTGIRKNQGLVCVTPEQAALKQQMIQSADKVIVLADVEKLDTDSVRLFASFDEIDMLIVDEPIEDKKFLDLLRKKDVELVIANEINEEM